MPRYRLTIEYDGRPYHGFQAQDDLRSVQGSIERSNVSGVSAMADMIRVERAYQTLANLMQRQDDLRGTAVQRLGDVTA